MNKVLGTMLYALLILAMIAALVRPEWVNYSLMVAGVYVISCVEFLIWRFGMMRGMADYALPPGEKRIGKILRNGLIIALIVSIPWYALVLWGIWFGSQPGHELVLFILLFITVVGAFRLDKGYRDSQQALDNIIKQIREIAQDYD